MSLGENIIRLRGEKNLSQEKLAAALGVSRQAISKWETDASVPELDKLLAMSELFGVTLDALVRGEAVQMEEKAAEKTAAAEPAPVQQTVIVERRGMPVRVILGILLLCFAALLTVVLLLLGGAADLLAMGFLVAPFLFSGIIALAVRKNTLLWCGWALWLFLAATVNWLTGMKLSLRMLLYGGGTLSGVFSWLFLLWLAALLVFTFHAFKNQKK